MIDLVSKMSSTMFVMRVELSDSSAVDVAINGSGLKYDSKSGMILRGEIGSISVSSLYGVGKEQTVAEIRQINNLDLSSDKLSEMFGVKFWNEAKLVLAYFDKLAHVSEGSTVSTFTKFKSDAYGSDSDDAISGSKFNDEIHGQGGDDDLLGGSGNDRLFGEKGDDALTGDAGDDFLFDMDGNNQFFGGSGRDILRGGAGIDQMDGGRDNDVLYGGGGFDWLRGGSGRDQFVFSVKDQGKLTIADFTDADVLVNIVYGSREESYKDFMEHARQSGRNVVYDNGETHVVLRAFKIGDLHVENFGDAFNVEALGLF